jgi:hypothetical protein
MRDMPTGMEQIWRSGDYTGDRRPIGRVTVQHPMMKLHTYHLQSTFRPLVPSSSGTNSILTSPSIDPVHGRAVTDIYANYLFNSPAAPKELPNVKSIKWSRTTDTDTGQCTIELWNTRPLAIGETPADGDLDYPGYYTPSRGLTTFSKRWGQEANEWANMLLPDNILRTYEGYGCNPYAVPELDAHLVITGLWKIDTVEFRADGTITVTCRDMASLLIDQMVFPPVIPPDFYPPDWQNWDGTFRIGTTSAKETRLSVRATHSSNEPWIGSGNIAGHKLANAFDGSPSSYWLSIGNVSPSRRFAYEWVECSVKKQSVNKVRFKTVKDGYTAYVSVKVGGVWQGAHSIDYHRDGIGMNGGDIPYVASAPVRNTDEWEIQFREYKNVEAVRLTLGNLQYFPGYGTYNYRAGISDVKVYGPVGGGNAILKGLTPGPAGANPGRYSDYTDIIKLLCCWGGLFWPGKDGYLYDSAGTQHAVVPTQVDAAVLGPDTGRAWGDFMDTGTNGPNPLGVDTFDKKSLMDGVKAIQDIIGYTFFIDATGGVQWRLPNIYSPGNWLTGMSASPGRTTRMYTIDEAQTLQDMSSTLDSSNVRDAIFVGNALSSVGAVVPGFNPNPTGLRRVAGWTDQGFSSQEEATVMADMITVRQLFSYRTNNVVIPGFPAIDIDDQVRLVERTTSEGWVHYVKGISSELDMTTGHWNYTLQTHWMGDRTYSRWIFDPGHLKPITGTYLQNINNLNRFPGGTRNIGGVLAP